VSEVGKRFGRVFNLDDAALEFLKNQRKYTVRPDDDEHDGWYNIVQKNKSIEIYIYSEIGYWGVTAQDFIKDMSEREDFDEVVLRINSPGGDVFDGLAILNYLRDLKVQITVKIDALAASAASFIAMAGDEVIMMPNSKMMIHQARGYGYGEADDLRAMADLLDDITSTIADIYTDRAGGEKSEWLDAMKKTTWYSAEEAVESGLADSVAEVAKSGSSKTKNRVAAIDTVSRIAAICTEVTCHPVVDADTDVDDFEWPEFDFRGAMQGAKDELDDVPWDAEQFRNIMSDVANNAPAIPEKERAKETPTDIEPVIDFSMIDAAIRAVSTEGKR
jgi:ATP-dependent Clp endopeptidase proteolytic subunit ClpP